MMGEHARLSASSASRWTRCPGSLALIESVPLFLRDRSSKYADEGTAAHALASLALETGESCAITVSANANPAWSLEMARDVQPYVDLVRDMAESHTLLIEQRVDYSKAIGVPESFGTADAIIVTNDGSELIVCDLKFGRGVEVSAEENEQLMLYALGAIETFDMVIERVNLKRVRLVISQPRLGAISEWDCSMDRLEEFRQLAMSKGRHAILLADKVDSVNYALDLSPGEKQCRFCPAASTCPALSKSVEQSLDCEFEAIVDDIAVPTSSDELSDKMKTIPMIEAWCTSVRAAVEARLLSGEPVSGFKLVEGRKGSRKWASAEEAETLLKSFRLTKEEMYDMTVISPTSAEKLLKDQPTRWKRLNALVTRADGKPSVTTEDDKRPALNVGELEFGPLTTKE